MGTACSRKTIDLSALIVIVAWIKSPSAALIPAFPQSFNHRRGLPCPRRSFSSFHWKVPSVDRLFLTSLIATSSLHPPPLPDPCTVVPATVRALLLSSSQHHHNPPPLSTSSHSTPLPPFLTDLPPARPLPSPSLTPNLPPTSSFHTPSSPSS